jgi:hypothetical protein
MFLELVPLLWCGTEEGGVVGRPAPVFPEAQQRRDPCFAYSAQLARDDGAIFAEEQAAFGVAHFHQADPQFDQHPGADFSR